ncbi:MAG: TldD/PmbA family protein [Candidatus Muirbacterium halophilum]|nr:TldD/PmbA family protein [Candidatus Muirbacterium halophilum]MCK9477387.1 TldD/PmbA family protein [Candidatus Muirbacterium halophilum]
MKNLAEIAVNKCKILGAEYADIRIVEMKDEELRVKNGKISDVTNAVSLGYGIRVIVDGAWGFAASSVMNTKDIEKTAELAVRIGKASSMKINKKVKLSKEKPYIDRWNSPYMIDPFKVGMDEKLGLLFEIDEILRKDKKIKNAESYMWFNREHQWFLSSEGSFIEQELLRSGGGFSVTSSDGNTFQKRSYPASFGQYVQGGYEVIYGLKLIEGAEKTREEAIELLTAENCPSGKKDLIIVGEQLALQIHESVGHATELDRVLGLEANYAGRSFVNIEKKGNFKYGSDIVNIVADPTAPTGLGTYGYDDDGVRAHRFHVIKNGIFENFLGNREFAHEQIENFSRACNRAEGWINIPIVRMPNLSLMPGSYKYEDLIKDTEDGIIVSTVKSWSIDQYRYNFQFGMEIAWLIENGKITKTVKNPTYQGITPEFWGSCDAICNEDYWKFWGVPNCGKGQPGQRAEMSHGCAPARFRKIEVGIV